MGFCDLQDPGADVDTGVSPRHATSGVGGWWCSCESASCGLAEMNSNRVPSANSIGGRFRRVSTSTGPRNGGSSPHQTHAARSTPFDDGCRTYASAKTDARAAGVNSRPLKSARCGARTPFSAVCSGGIGQRSPGTQQSLLNATAFVLVRLLTVMGKAQTTADTLCSYKYE